MRILIVDSTDRVRKTLIKYLNLETMFDTVFEASTVSEAKRILSNIKTEVVLMDIQLPGQNGLELINYCKTIFYKPIVIICSNYGMQNYKNMYEKLAINYFFDKSSELIELKKFIKTLVKNSQNKIRNTVRSPKTN